MMHHFYVKIIISDFFDDSKSSLNHQTVTPLLHFRIFQLIACRSATPKNGEEECLTELQQMRSNSSRISSRRHGSTAGKSTVSRPCSSRTGGTPTTSRISWHVGLGNPWQVGKPALPAKGCGHETGMMELCPGASSLATFTLATSYDLTPATFRLVSWSQSLHFDSCVARPFAATGRPGNSHLSWYPILPWKSSGAEWTSAFLQLAALPQ